MPRSTLAAWEASRDRPDPVALLGEQSRDRVSELVPIRYGRMLASPFAFYRGAASLMASDLAGSPRTGLHAQLCGDAHLSNFGGFLAPDRKLVFSINDFDETLPGPFEWDVKRLAASLAVAGRDRGFSARERKAICLRGVRSYRLAMREFAATQTFDVWYARLTVSRIFKQWGKEATPKVIKRVKRNVAKARTKDSLLAFEKLTHLVNGRPRIKSAPPLIIPLEKIFRSEGRKKVEEFLRSVVGFYRHTLADEHRRLLDRFHYADAARKVVGVGSVGLRAWIILMVGRDEHDPLFLQLKEAHASVLEPFLGTSEYSNHGQRIVEGQRLMQTASDILLGWSHAEDFEGLECDFYVRQLWDGKASSEIELMDPPWMATYAEVCGWTLARAHARSGDIVAIASYLGGSDVFEEALASFAETYADQNERDHQALKDAVAQRRVNAKTGL